MIAPAATVPAPPVRNTPAWFFPALVVGLLFFQIALCLAGAYMANRGSAAVVEDDYYNKALHWDDQQAAERASAALGWHAKIQVSAAPDLMKEREFLLTLTDAHDAPLTGATIDLIFYHRARALDVQHATLRDLGEGHYSASLPLARIGIWDIRLAIAHGTDRFQAHQLVEVVTEQNP